MRRATPYFHQVEEQVLLDFDGEGYVVATGGSAIYFGGPWKSSRSGAEWSICR